MPESLLYWRAIATAVVISSLFVLIAARMSAPRTNETWLNTIGGLGIGLGLLSGYYLLTLNLAWPPRNGLDRLLLIVIPIAIGIELIAGFLRSPRRGTWLLRICFAATVPRILLHGSVHLSDWTWWQAAASIAVSGVLLLGEWSLLLWLSQRRPGVSIPAALCLTIHCAGATVMMAGYIKGGAAAFPLAATLLATAFAGMVVRKHSRNSVDDVAPIIIGTGVVGLFGVLFIGLFFGRVSTCEGLTVFLAPLLCWATEIPPLKSQKPLVVGSLRLLLVSIPLMIVVISGWREFDRDLAPLLGGDETFKFRTHERLTTKALGQFEMMVLQSR